jgi:hypothetical protein
MGTKLHGNSAFRSKHMALQFRLWPLILLSLSSRSCTVNLILTKFEEYLCVYKVSVVKQGKK